MPLFQISLVSLSLLDELLQKPHQDVLQLLLLRYLDSRSYLEGHAHPAAAGRAESPYDSE